MNNTTEELNKLSIRELINLQAKINKMIEAKKREVYTTQIVNEMSNLKKKFNNFITTRV